MKFEHVSSILTLLLFTRSGLLAPVREATAAVDKVRMTSERAMFLLTKMQLIMGFQTELIYKQLVSQPDNRDPYKVAALPA